MKLGASSCPKYRKELFQVKSPYREKPLMGILLAEKKDTSGG